MGGTTDLVYADLRNAVQAVAARRRPARHRPRPHLPAARRPLAGHGRDPGRGGVRHRPHGRDRRQARAAAVPDGARPARRGLARWSSATGSAPTSPRPPRRASTRRWCAATAATTTSWTASSPSRWRSATRWPGCSRDPHERLHLPHVDPHQRARLRRDRQPGPRRPRQRPRPGPARAPRAGGPRRRPPRSPCSCRRAAPPPRRSAARGAAAAAAPRAPPPRPRSAAHRHVVPVEPRRLVGGQVVARAHHRDHQPHAAPAQVRDLGRPPVGAVVAPPSPRPLQRAQLARPRPPDPPRLLHGELHARGRTRGARVRPPRAAVRFGRSCAACSAA